MPLVSKEKSCGRCAHAMMVEGKPHIYCMVKGPLVLAQGDGYITVFPMLMPHGKCDLFRRGENQRPNPAPDIPSESN